MDQSNYNNWHCCLNPPKFYRQDCPECMFNPGCIFQYKLIKYKLGKPIRYKDLTEEERELHAKQSSKGPDK